MSLTYHKTSIQRFDQFQLENLRQTEQRTRRLRHGRKRSLLSSDLDPTRILGFEICQVAVFVTSVEMCLNLTAFIAVAVDLTMTDFGKLIIAKGIVAISILLAVGVLIPVIYAALPRCSLEKKARAQFLLPYILVSPLIALGPLGGKALCSNMKFMCLHVAYGICAAILAVIKCYCLYVLYKLRNCLLLKSMDQEGPIEYSSLENVSKTHL